MPYLLYCLARQELRRDRCRSDTGRCHCHLHVSHSSPDWTGEGAKWSTPLAALSSRAVCHKLGNGSEFTPRVLDMEGAGVLGGVVVVLLIGSWRWRLESRSSGVERDYYYYYFYFFCFRQVKNDREWSPHGWMLDHYVLVRLICAHPEVFCALKLCADSTKVLWMTP